MLGDDEEAIREVIEVFLEESLELCGTILDGIADESPSAWHRAAHSLKSISGQVGALELSRVAGELEKAGSSGDVGVGHSLAPRLEALVATARQDLQALVTAA